MPAHTYSSICSVSTSILNSRMNWPHASANAYKTLPGSRSKFKRIFVKTLATSRIEFIMLLNALDDK